MAYLHLVEHLQLFLGDRCNEYGQFRTFYKSFLSTELLCKSGRSGWREENSDL